MTLTISNLLSKAWLFATITRVRQFRRRRPHVQFHPAQLSHRFWANLMIIG